MVILPTQPVILEQTEVQIETAAGDALRERVLSDADLRPVFEKLVGLMKRPQLTTDEKIRVLRTFQIAATESPAGVSADVKKQVHDALIPQFPSAPSTAESTPPAEYR